MVAFYLTASYSRMIEAPRDRWRGSGAPCRPTPSRQSPPMIRSGRRSQAPRCASRAAATAPWCSTSACCGDCTRPDLLGSLQRISSVSGGSITAGVLALKWRRLSFDPARLRGRFRSRSGGAAAPPRWRDPRRRCDRRRRTFSRQHQRPRRGGLRPTPVRGRHAARPARRTTLRHQRDQCSVRRAMALQKPYMRDYRVGEVKAPTIPLARAVAASSAFPPGAVSLRASARER